MKLIPAVEEVESRSLESEQAANAFEGSTGIFGVEPSCKFFYSVLFGKDCCFTVFLSW